MKHYKVDLNQVRNAIASAAPKQPLAWNDRLATAAQKHSQDQASNGFQSHTGSDGSDMNTRVDREGYGKRTSTGENAYAYAKSVDHAMQAFLIDWGVASAGHRKNILQPDTPDSSSYREVGIGIAASNRPNFGPNVVTQDFGSREGAKANLLGVVFDDKNHNSFYDAGEGMGGVVIDIKNLANNAPDERRDLGPGGIPDRARSGLLPGVGPGRRPGRAKRDGQHRHTEREGRLRPEQAVVRGNGRQGWPSRPRPAPAPAPKVEAKV